LVLVTAVLMTVSLGRAADLTWDGPAGGDWFVNTNWDDGVGDPATPPTASDNVKTHLLDAVINNAATAVANEIVYGPNYSDAWLDITTDLTVTDNIQLANLCTGQVNQFGGTTTAGGSVVIKTRDDTSFWKMSSGAVLDVGENLIVSFNDAYMEQVASSSVTVYNDLAVAAKGTSNGGVAYEMTGGTLTVNTLGGSSATRAHGLGVGYSGAGLMVQSGGTLTVNNGGDLGVASRGHSSAQSGNGEYVISGTGALSVDGTVVLGSTNSDSETSPPTAGVGQFTVIGSGAGTITVGEWDQRAETAEGRGDLKALVDAGGIKTINVLADAFFGAGSQLILDFADGVDPYAGTWTLMSLSNGTITDDGLVFAAGVDPSTGPDEEGWTMDVGDTALTIGYVTQPPPIPEPATMSLVALGLGAVAVRIRRRLA
jgi:hypothetical protein